MGVPAIRPEMVQVAGPGTVPVMTRILLSLCAVVSLALPADAPRVVFSDDFKDWYPEVIDAAAGALAGLPVEAPVTVASPHQLWTAVVTRTDGVAVPYERSLGRIEIAGDERPTTVIQVHGFRTVAVAWINDRLLRVNLGLGRVAEVEAIYDLQGRRWMYRDSLSYPP
jgi:hypothetical protein